MNDEENSLPSPDDAAEKVAEMPPKVNLRHYLGALEGMRAKGYSFREIAEWISEFLGVKINRSQVVYLLTADPDRLEEEAEDEYHEQEMDDRELEDARGYTPPPPSPSPAAPPPPPPPQKPPRSRKKSKP